MNYCAEEFKKQHQKDLSSNAKAMHRLRNQCEQAKLTLSSYPSTTITVDALFEGIDFSLQITRAKFEDLCSDLFIKCIKPIEDALSDVKMSKADIDQIVLVGGSSRIPKVRE